MKRKISFTLLILIMLGVIVYFYIKDILIPVHLKDFFVSKLASFTNREVQVDKIGFSFIRGIEIKNLEISQKEYPEKPFFKTKDLRIQILLIPFLKTKKIIIPNINIVEPSIFITKNTDGKWDFSDLLENKSQKKQEIQIIVTKINLNKGSLNLIDKTSFEPYVETLSDIRASAAINIDKSIGYSLNFRSSKKTNGSIEGNYKIETSEIETALNLQEINVPDYTKLFDIAKPSNIAIDNFYINSIKSKINFDFKNNNLSFDGSFSVNKFDGKISDVLINLTNTNFTNIKATKEQSLIKLAGSIKSEKTKINNDDISIDNDLTANLISELDLNDNKLSINGAVFIDNSNILAFGNGILSKNLKLEIESLVIGETTALFGNLEINKANITNKTFTLGGSEIAINNLNIKKDDLATLINYDLKSKNTTLSLKETPIKYSGDIDAEGLKITLNDNFQLTTNLNAENSKIILNESELAAGDFSFTNLLYSQKEQRLFTAAMLINDLALKADDQLNLKGTLAGQDISISLKNNQKIINATNIAINNSAVTINKDISYSGNVSIENSKTELTDKIITNKSKLKLSDGKIIFSTGKLFEGNSNVDLQLDYDLTNPKSTKYFAEIKLLKNKLSNIEYVDTIDSIEGRIILKNDHANFTNLTFNVLNNPVLLNSLITDFNKPDLTLRATSNKIIINNLTPLIDELFKKYGVELSGLSTIDIGYNGPLLKFDIDRLSVRSKLKDAFLKLTSIKNPFTNINGSINYKKDNISWENLSFYTDSRKIKIDGELNKFSRPTITTRVDSEDFNFNTDLKILNRAFQIVYAKGVLFNSAFDIKGDVHLLDDNQPDLDLRIQADLNLNDLKRIPDKTIQENITKFNPTGIFTIEGLFKGTPKNWKDWQLNLKASSENSTISDVTLKKIELTYKQRDKFINNFNATGYIYDGRFSFQSSVDLNKDDLLSKLDFVLENINLELLRKDKKIVQKQFAGKLSFETNLQGPLLDTNKISGVGSASITDGYLAQMIPGYKNSIFTSAAGEFFIKDNKLTTDKTELFSENVNLSIAGWIDINKSIYFDIIPKISLQGIASSSDIKIDPSEILRGAVSLTCTGKIDKPQCKPNASPVKLIGNTTDMIRKGIGSILEGIL